MRGVRRLIVDPVKAERGRPFGARLGYVGGEPCSGHRLEDRVEWNLG